MLATRDLPSRDTLFPLSQGVASWSVSNKVRGSLELTKKNLNAKKVASGLPLNITTGPNKKPSLRVGYPKGSYRLDVEPRGGISFYTNGPKGFNLTNAKEATFGYSVYFPKGFEFVKGGKLPGLYGGNSEEDATTCSGGTVDHNCFSGRLMWRMDGAGEIYAYLPGPEHVGFESNRLLCSLTRSHCDTSFGVSLGRGSFKFPTGEWTTIAERIRLNDVGQANGELELFIDGKSVVNSVGAIIRNDSSSRIRGIQVQSFFGGSTEDWASPKDQEVFLSDFSVAITEDFEGRRTSGVPSYTRLGWKGMFPFLALMTCLSLGLT
ncbi:alginate lyase [Coprinopsis cinerea AmutBmut pab1-1]|nr:alginate lyase [Coprinopsis cinerea AmutBmut pab1-1]